MSLRINNNVNALNAHRNLLLNDHSLSKTLEKLSSGLKINRAADGPADLVISEQMRGQIAGMTQAIDNSESAISMVQTTEANLAEINRMLVYLRQLAVHAANEGANDESMLLADQRELANTLESIDRIAAQAQFGAKKLLDGTNGVSGTVAGAGLEFLGAGLKIQASGKEGFLVKVTQNATQAEAKGTVALSPDLIKQGETLRITQNGKTVEHHTGPEETAEQVVMKLQGEAAQKGLQIVVSMDEAGKLLVRHEQFGSKPTFEVFSSSAGVLSSQAGVVESARPGQDVAGTINGESALGAGQVLTGVKGAEKVDGLAVKVKGPLGNPDGELPPEGVEAGRIYLTQNALRFQVGGNFGQAVSLNIGDVHSKQFAKGVENRSGFQSLSDLDLRQFNGAQDAMLLIDKAITEVSSLRGELGAFQKNLLESNLNNLRVANENLISSESVLRDTDMASEMAAYTRGQIMTQSATAMLAQANQLPNQVLRLLK